MAAMKLLQASAWQVLLVRIKNLQMSDVAANTNSTGHKLCVRAQAEARHTRQCQHAAPSGSCTTAQQCTNDRSAPRGSWAARSRASCSSFRRASSPRASRTRDTNNCVCRDRYLLACCTWCGVSFAGGALWDKQVKDPGPAQIGKQALKLTCIAAERAGRYTGAVGW